MVGRKKIATESANELTDQLKGFENKVIIDKLRTIEKNIALFLKERKENQRLLKELEQAVTKLTIALEESMSYAEELEARAANIHHIKDSTQWN